MQAVTPKWHEVALENFTDNYMEWSSRKMKRQLLTRGVYNGVLTKCNNNEEKKVTK